MKSNIKYGIFLVVAFSLVALSVYTFSGSQDSAKVANVPFNDNVKVASNPSQDSDKVASNPSQDSDKVANNADQRITIPISAAIVTYTHDDLNKYSDTIITGTVKEKLPSKWNTIDGKQPNKAVTELSYHDLIYTDTVISVDKYLKNPLSSKEVIVRSIGGTLGNLVMTSDDEPSLEPGEKILLFLSKDTNTDLMNFGPEHFIVTGFFQGKFVLTDDGKVRGWNNESISKEELLGTKNNN